MEKPKLTASAIVNFSEKLEDYTSTFYKNLADKFPDEKDTFLSFVEESKKSKIVVVRTYRETISDALEACFAFEALQLEKYEINKVDVEKMTYQGALKAALQLEGQARGFYTEVAERSRSLLATIATAFRKVAKVRGKREDKLRSIIT